jgi:hypothetical protein
MKEKSHKLGKWKPSSTYAFIRTEKGEHRRARASVRRRLQAVAAQLKTLGSQ